MRGPLRVRQRTMSRRAADELICLCSYMKVAEGPLSCLFFCLSLFLSFSLFLVMQYDGRYARPVSRDRKISTPYTSFKRLLRLPCEHSSAPIVCCFWCRKQRALAQKVALHACDQRFYILRMRALVRSWMRCGARVAYRTV